MGDSGEESSRRPLPPLDPSKWMGGTTPDDPSLSGPAHCTRGKAALSKSSLTVNEQTTRSEVVQNDNSKDAETTDGNSVEEKNSTDADQHCNKDSTPESGPSSNKQRFVIISDQESCGTSLFSLDERQATEILMSALGSGFDPSGDWSKAKRTRQLGITCKDHNQFMKAQDIQDFKSQTGGIKLTSRIPEKKCWGLIRGIHRHVVPDIADLKDKLIGAKLEGVEQDRALETCLSSLSFTRRNTVIKVNEDGRRVYKDGKPVIEETNSVQFCFYGDSLPEALRFDGMGWRRVEPYAFKVQHCWRCLGYTHLGKDCKTITTHCGFCSGPHTTRDCDKKDQRPSCFHCKKDHPVWSSDCPRRRQEQELAQIRAGTTMTRAMAWIHLKEKERKKEDQVSRQVEIKKQVDRIGNNLNQELAEINQHAIQEMERQDKEVKKLESQYKRLSNTTATDQAKTNQDIAALQRANKELRGELAKMKEEMEGLKTELRKRDRNQTHSDRNFTDYDPMERFENRDVVFRTDQGPRQQGTPRRHTHCSPSQEQKSARKARNHEDTPRRHPHIFSGYVRRSARKDRDQQESVAVAQWESRYQEQEGRHRHGPMKSVSYAAAATGLTTSRYEHPKARRALAVRK